MSERPGKKPRASAPAIDASLAWAFGAATAAFHQAMAERLGLGVTDHKCLELVHRAGPDAPVTPGLLAERTRLTSGAITAVLDRLEKAGFVRRDKDPDDRRQVVVRIVPERARELAGLYEPLAVGWRALCAELDGREQAVIQAFLERSAALLLREAEGLRGAPEPPGARAGEASALSAPRGRTARGRLEVVRGLTRATLSAGPPELLYRVRSEGAPPKVTVRDGHVRVEPARSLARLLRRPPLELELCPAIPWELVLRGGISELTADLRGLRLSGLELGSGAHAVTVHLPRPAGAVPVRISGGAHKIRLLRPTGVPARVVVGGGGAGVVLDTLQLDGVGGEVRWETPDFAASEDRYDIAVGGGSHEFVVSFA